MLVERYRQRLESLVHLRVGGKLRGRIEVDDVLQEAYLGAYKTIDQFRWRGEASFYHWLRQIVEHVILNMSRYHFSSERRDASREVALEGGSRDGDPGRIPAASEDSPSKALRRKERFDRLESALSSLSPDHREVIILARIEGLPLKEIGRRMGRSPDAVSMLLLRALKSLRAFFGTTDSIRLPSDCAIHFDGTDPEPPDPQGGG